MSFSVGDNVTVDGYEGTGVVKFVGDANHGDFVGKKRIGVQYDEAIGKMSGKMGGVQYWSDCPKKHGVFVPPKKVTAVPGAVKKSENGATGASGSSPPAKPKKMGEKKLVKVLKEYYKKVAKNPAAKTDEQLVALAQKIRASDRYTDIINGPMLKKYGKSFDAFAAEREERLAKKKAAEAGGAEPEPEPAPEPEPEPEPEVAAADDAGSAMTEEQLLDHLTAFYEAHAPGTKTAKALSKDAKKYAGKDLAKLDAPLEKKFGETLTEFIGKWDASMAVPELEPAAEPEGFGGTEEVEETAEGFGGGEDDAQGFGDAEEDGPAGGDDVIAPNPDYHGADGSEQPVYGDDNVADAQDDGALKERTISDTEKRLADAATLVSGRADAWSAADKAPDVEQVAEEEFKHPEPALSSEELDMDTDGLRAELLAMKKAAAAEASKALYVLIEAHGAAVSLEKVRALHAKGASFTAYTDPGTLSTALHEIAAWDVAEVMQIAMQGASQSHTNLNAVNKDNETALWYACQFGAPACAKLLIDAGARTDIKDKRGRTPLKIAEMNSQRDLITMLGGVQPEAPAPEESEAFGFQAVDDEVDDAAPDGSGQTAYEKELAVIGAGHNFSGAGTVEVPVPSFPVMGVQSSMQRRNSVKEFFGGFEGGESEGSYQPVTPFDWGPNEKN